jgi:hypothetical protein
MQTKRKDQKASNKKEKGRITRQKGKDQKAKREGSKGKMGRSK